MAELSEVVGRIADEFTSRVSRGERPQLDEYLERYPDHAETLAQVLPLILAMGANWRPNIPGYEDLREIGRGGMGVVYEARQVGLNRFVALKMILLGGAAPADAVRRFLDEAELTARLNHPHIVPVYERGHCDVGPFLAMELIRGHSLAEVLATKTMTPREAAELVRKLAGAMGHAHQQRVIHRDLKPANVLIDEHGEPHVTDFGLARRLEGGSDVTATGAIVGTASYLSPEQASAGKGIGPDTDIWALGAILYECLTGRPPFRGANTLDTLLLVRHADPVPPQRLQPGLPRDLEVIALKCLEKQPHRRYASAQALADDLGRFVAGQPILARRAGPLEHAWKWVCRWPATAALVALSAVVLVILLALFVSWQHVGGLEQANRHLDDSLAQLKDERASAQAQRELVHLYPERIQRAHAAAVDGNLLAAQAILAECPAELRGWEWAYVDQLIKPAGRRIVSEAGPIRAAEFFDNGDKLATLARSNDKGTLEVWVAGTGKRLAVAEFDWRGTNQVALVVTARSVEQPHIPPQVVVALAGEPCVCAFSSATGESLGHHRVACPAAVLRVALSADGTRAAFLDDERTIRVVGCHDGKQVVELQNTKQKDIPCAVALSANGNQLAVAHRSHFVVHDLTGKVKPTSILGGGDTQSLVCFCDLGGGSHVWFHTAKSIQPTILSSSRGVSDVFPRKFASGTAIAFRPQVNVTGKAMLAIAGEQGELRLQWLGDGRPYRTYIGLEGPPTGLSFARGDYRKLPPTPIPEVLAVVEAGGAVRLWDCSQDGDSEAVGRSLGELGLGGYVALARVNEVNLHFASRIKPFDQQKFGNIMVRSGSLTKTPSLLDQMGRVKVDTFGEGLGCVSPSGRFAWPASEPGAWVFGWIPDGETMRVKWNETFCPTPTRPLAMTFVKDRLFLACEDGGLWGGLPDTATWVQRRTRSALPIMRPTGLADTPTGLLLVAAGDKVALVEPDSRQLVATLQGDAPLVALPVVNDAGTMLAWPEAERVSLWDLSTQRRVAQIAWKPAVAVGEPLLPPPIAFSPDGRLAVAGADGLVRIHETKTGQVLLALSTPSQKPFVAIGFSRHRNGLHGVDAANLYSWWARPAK